VAVLPGSRRGEVKRLLPVFGTAVARLAARRPDLRVVVPTRETVAAMVSAAASGWAAPAIVVRGEAEKYAAFAASNAAIAASGTVALELAMAKVPHLVGYRLLPLTHWQLRRIVKVKYAHLLNLILDRPVVPLGARTAERGASRGGQDRRGLVEFAGNVLAVVISSVRRYTTYVPLPSAFG